jgi:hypothetical protein
MKKKTTRIKTCIGILNFDEPGDLGEIFHRKETKKVYLFRNASLNSKYYQKGCPLPSWAVV